MLLERYYVNVEKETKEHFVTKDNILSQWLHRARRFGTYDEAYENIRYYDMQNDWSVMRVDTILTEESH